MSENIYEKTAEILIDIGSVNFSPDKPFKLTSGKLSPVYCDCRKIISFPKERNILMKYAKKKITDQSFYKGISNIAGGETAGIPFASFLADKLNQPMTYIRKKKKDFGKKERIEGILNKNDKVILVEDLLTDGGSKIDFINAIHDKGSKVIAIFVIFNYGVFNELFYLKKKKIKLIYLTNWKNILKIAKKKGVLQNEEVQKISEFLISLGVKNLK